MNGWSDAAKPESWDRLTIGKCGEDSTSSRLSTDEAVGQAKMIEKLKSIFYFLDILRFAVWWTIICLSVIQVRISEPNNDEQFWIRNSTIDDITSASCLPDVIVVDSVLNKLFDTHKPRLNGFIPFVSAFSDIRWRIHVKPFNNKWLPLDRVDRILNKRKKIIKMKQLGSYFFLVNDIFSVNVESRKHFFQLSYWIESNNGSGKVRRKCWNTY